MTETGNNKTKSYIDHNTFGGIINFSDFDTNYCGKVQKESSIARRIASDWRFDRQCETNIKSRNIEV